MGKPQLLEIGNKMFITNPYRFAGGGGGGNPWDSHVDFDGTNDYINATAATVNPGGDMSVSMWVKPDQLSALRYFLFSNGSLAFGSSSAGKLRLIAAGSTNKAWSFANTDGSATLTTSSWQHVVFTTDTNGIYWYLDGVSDGSNTTYTGGLNSDPDFILGGRVGTSYYDGKMADVRIYDKTLTTDDITYIYTSGASGTNPAANLIRHWRLDEGSGTTAADSVGGYDGTATNITESTFWVPYTP